MVIASTLFTRRHRFLTPLQKKKKKKKKHQTCLVRLLLRGERKTTAKKKAEKNAWVPTMPLPALVVTRSGSVKSGMLLFVHLILLSLYSLTHIHDN